MSKAKPSIISTFFVHVFFGFVRLIAFLPYSWLTFIGRGVGRLLFKLGNRRAIVEANLRYCFPELSFDKRQEILKKHFLHLGEGLLELPAAWHKSFDSLESMHEIRGLEHYQRIKDSGRGIVFLGYHTTNIELVGALMAKYLDYSAFYRVNDHPTVEHYIQSGRDNRTNSIDKKDLRAVKRLLQNGGGLWLNSDQDSGLNGTIFSRFFGKPMATLKSPMRLAKLGKAAVLPLSYHKDKSGKLIIEVLPEVTFTGDEDVDCLMCNKITEACIMQAPEQYYWVHRRFKTLPQGQRGIYFSKPPKLKRITLEEHQGALNSGEVIAELHGAARRVRTPDGQILQVFSKQSSFPPKQTEKDIQRYMRSCSMLAMRGFYSISPQEFTYCAPAKSYMIRYKDFDALPIAHIPATKAEPMAKLLARWVAQLHSEGVALKPNKFSNIQLLAQGQFAVLDPSGCVFYQHAVMPIVREKDCQELFGLIPQLATEQFMAVFEQQYQESFEQFTT